MRRAGGRATAAYPRIVLDGDEGEQESFGDNAPPKFFNGQVRIEIVTRETDGRPDPDAQIANIRTRCVQIALGSKLTPTLKGVVFTGASGEKWSVTRLTQVRPTGPLPVVDPVFCRHRTTLAVSLNRMH